MSIERIAKWSRRNPGRYLDTIAAAFMFLGLTGGFWAIKADDPSATLVAGVSLGVAASSFVVSVAENTWTCYRRKEFHMDMALWQGKSLSEDEAWKLAESRER